MNVIFKFSLGLSGVPNSTYGFDSRKPFRTIYLSQTYRIRKARLVWIFVYHHFFVGTIVLYFLKKKIKETV